MNGRKIVWLLGSLLALSVMASPPTVRLVPGPDGNYCQRDNAGLIVVVATGKTPFSGAVEVTFSKAAKPLTQTITLTARQTKKLSFAIPAGCFQPDCGASIRVTNGVSAAMAARGAGRRHVYVEAVATCLG
jgi:hypothetical protein